jgi:PPP family 3-phenylpropionic acid transporter
VIFQLAGVLYGEFGQKAFLGMLVVSAIGMAAIVALARTWKGNLVVGGANTTSLPQPVGGL